MFRTKLFWWRCESCTILRATKVRVAPRKCRCGHEVFVEKVTDVPITSDELPAAAFLVPVEASLTLTVHAPGQELIILSTPTYADIEDMTALLAMIEVGARDLDVDLRHGKSAGSFKLKGVVR